ncbi:MAG TPA: YebC/PmpR family DNA-binding transcriptional regulator [Kofleriaceae bacterium]|nr:YebC/PmpR family DNA-binding transcriptional regulator [Kofleriaceae bacterium]
MGAMWKNAGKSAAAAAKGKIISKMAKEIIVAAKNGADPNGNPRLRMAIDAAKRQSVPRDTIERAIKKGSGQLDGPVNYDAVTYEGFGPHRVPVIVECLTDNRNRTATNIRVLFRKFQLGNTGSVSWDFNHLGMIIAAAEEGAPDAETAAIEAGAQDFEAGEEGTMVFYSEPTDLDAVSKALAAQKWTVTSSKMGWKAKNLMSLDEAAMAEVTAFLQEVDADDDVQEIYTAL